MKSNIIKKIDDFARRHLLLSSFLCLFILGIIINTYWAFDRPGLRRTFLYVAAENILTTFVFGSIPIFLVSLLLYSFIKKGISGHSDLAFSKRFVLSFIPTFIITLLFYLWYASSHYKPSDYYLGAVFVSSVYSVIFAAYFGWLSNATKKRIIGQCTIINLLMVFFNILTGFLYSPVM